MLRELCWSIFRPLCGTAASTQKKDSGPEKAGPDEPPNPTTRQIKTPKLAGIPIMAGRVVGHLSVFIVVRRAANWAPQIVRPNNYRLDV